MIATRRSLAPAAFFVAAIAAFLGIFAAQAFAVGAGVTETPRTDTLRVTNGEVLDSVIVGNRVVLVGTFTQVQDAGGSTFDQRFIAAYNADTGDFDPSFAPDVDAFVNSIATDGTNFFIGGQFSNVDGEAHRRIAKLNANGSVNSRFTASIGSTPATLDVAHGKVYVGGNFTSVNNVARDRFAAVDSTTGALDSVTDFSFTGSASGGGIGVRWIEVSPNGNFLFLSHTARQIDSQVRTGIAKFDISANSTSLSSWQTRHFEDFLVESGFNQRVRRLAISPDGSYVVIVTSGNDRPPTNDVAIRFPTSGGSGVTADWVSRHFDTVLGVVINGDTVFVGGHFQFQEAPGSTDPFPGDPDTTFGFGGNQGPIALGSEVVQREQLGALDPNTGKSLDWNPGSDSFLGVQSLTWSDRYGLIVGHDGNRLGGVQIGAHAVFPPGNSPTPPPPLPGTGALECEATIANGSATVDFTGDLGSSLQIIRNGAWAGTVTGDSITISANGGDSISARVRGPIYSSPFEEISCDVTTTGGGGGGGGTPPAADFSCSVAFDGGSATVTFTGDLGTSLNVVRNGSWAGTVTGNSITINANDGDTIEARLRGPNYSSPFQDIACNTGGGDGGGTPTPGDALTCAASVNGSSATVSFDGDLGTSIQVTRNGSWAGTVTGDSITINASADDNIGARVRGPNYSSPFQEVTCSVSDDTPAPQPGDITEIDTRITAPFNGAVTSTNVQITGESEAPNGVDRMRLTVQRVATGQYLTADGSFTSAWTPLDIEFDGTSQEESWSYDAVLPFAGQYSIAVRTFDVNNARDTTVTRSFVVGVLDDAPPEVLANGPAFNGDFVNLSGSATDDLGVTEVSLLLLNRDITQYYRLDGTLGAAQRIQTTLDNPGGTSTNWSITFEDLPPGNWQATIDAIDTTGQRDRRSRSFTIAE